MGEYMGEKMESKVSVRGQTVIPKEIRKALGITENSRLYWKIQDGVIQVLPLPADPVQASLGLLRGKGTFGEFLQGRNEERHKELVKETQK